MHTETLASDTKKILDRISGQSFIKPFYLSGGTALALHLGHRESEDLDFFTSANFDPAKLQQRLEKVVPLSGVALEVDTLNCYADSVKLQFLHYPYKLLTLPVVWNNLPISSVSDIACTKLLTISSRGSKKDFVDLYFILQSFTLPKLFGLLSQKYQEVDFNLLHILKSLVYFKDADDQPMPRMHQDVSWPTIKKAIITCVKEYDLVSTSSPPSPPSPTPRA